MKDFCNLLVGFLLNDKKVENRPIAGRQLADKRNQRLCVKTFGVRLLIGDAGHSRFLKRDKEGAVFPQFHQGFVYHNPGEPGL